MTKVKGPKNILLVEAFGFAVIILFLWLDEILDLPHKFFGAPVSSINRIECYFETAIVVFLAVVVMSITASLAVRLRRSDTEKARLFGVISDDLRNPFTNLIGNADLLRNNFNDLSEDERKSLSSGIFEASDNVRDLLENLLHWSQIQLDSSLPPASPCDLHELVEAGIAHVGLAATRKHIVITNGIPKETLVDVDEQAIRSVVRNLLSNAVKFSKSGGVVEVTTKGRGSKIRMIVADRGVGMNKKELKGLFHIGTYLSEMGTAGETGSGLGLLLVDELIRRGGSKLKVRSDVGKGSAFSFTLKRSRGAKGPAKREEFRREEQE
jgi:two-component system, sensor histidine kinase and response regulator